MDSCKKEFVSDPHSFCADPDPAFLTNEVPDPNFFPESIFLCFHEKKSHLKNLHKHNCLNIRFLNYLYLALVFPLHISDDFTTPGSGSRSQLNAAPQR
jgi:hypothetical protein